jgi:cleavage stimulation factor subunit 3
MADAEAEEAFSGAEYNEPATEADSNSGEHEAMVEQIEPSVEYDPAQSVPDLSVPVSSSHADSSLPVATSTDGLGLTNTVVERPRTAQEYQPDASLTLQTAPLTSGDTVPSPLDGVRSPQSQPHSAQPEMPTSATATHAPRARLAHDTVGILEDRIKEDPKGDTEAWLRLIEEHKTKGRFDDARKVYDRFFEVFPQAVS